MPQALILLILAQIWLSRSRFVFELEVDLDSVTAGNFSCDSGIFDNAQCLLYLEVFCLREGRGNSQSTNGTDCPLGRNNERMNAYLEDQPNTRRITSDSPWPVTFQLYTQAKDSDPGLSSDDDIDDIIINKALEVNTSYTEMETFTGILNRVSLRARFRVMCQQDYYGADCSTFCVAQNHDDVNGHYTCNRRDGSILLTKIIVPLSVILLIMVFIMVIIVVIIKRRRKWKTHCDSEVHQEMDSMFIKMTDNPVYGQLSAESNTASVIYEIPRHDATEITCVQNLVYGVNTRVNCNVDNSTLISVC